MARKKKETVTLPLVGMIAIVGRPNVGKSTLFNRLVGQRRAIVGDEPGITRDRLYGYSEWAGKRLRVVDTGGIVPDDEALIPAEIFRQAKVALEEADVIVMVVDARTELASPDIDLARLLQRTGKPLILAVNKIDDPKLESYVEDFRRLGIRTMVPISAEHSTGVAELLEEILERIPEKAAGDKTVEDKNAGARPALRNAKTAAEPADTFDDQPSVDLDSEIDDAPHEGAEQPDSELTPEIKIAIIGRPNVGKSTMLNRLTGTARAIVSPIAGTTRDAVDEVVERDGQIFRFIDTAGIRRKGKTRLMAEKLSVVMARKHLEAADLALVLIDATEGVTAIDATIAGYAHEAGRSVIVVINKWDLVTINRADGKPAAKVDIFEEQVRRHLKFLNYAPIVFASAETGYGSGKIYEAIELVARERRKRIATGEMNRFLKHVDFERAGVPYSQRVRILYMTQAAVSPPTFILFTDRATPLHFSYRRFLENQIRDAFQFVGTPIWIKSRARNANKDEE
ncbi:Small GTP-binding protein [Candidatus Koribacter versatilis Ellin345]|uniref:GTPase Der n=1 Tax=Koribacter versatilis (strain Ellin345) TaxID=204669 RepID=Q1IHL7_KORVE|nr:ribosome biogenesis GTPase Der [Candidatus Koribacter versatilis]ABF43633.1 Small GTP-binding protein [Candidatus Koribacter versatilis Ellin345]